MKVLALAIAALTVVGGIATAAVIAPGTNGPGLTSVGPVSATDGFPVWYKDKTGLRLENCISQADPLCPAFGALPDPAAPVSFPDNYPDEGFYSLVNANLNTGNNGKALLVVALEQAFRNGPVADGDQVTFARMRLKLTNAQDGVPYTFTTPAGTKTMTTSGKVAGLVFDTEDIGIGGQGDFSGALGGRVGPFLTWDTYPTDPALKPVAPAPTPTSETVRPRTRSRAARTEQPTTSSASKGRASTPVRRSTPAPPSPARSRTASRPTCSPCRARSRRPAA